MSCANCSGKVERVGKYLVCYACNESQLSYSKPEQIGYTPERVPQIVKDFQKYESVSDITDKAVEIYQEVVGGNTLKSDRRRAMLCVCAYEAYKSFGRAKDPILLSKKYGITQVQLRDASNEFRGFVFEKELQDKYRKIHLTAKQLIPEFTTLLNIDDPDMKKLNNIVDELYEKMVMVARIAPRDVAIGVVFWYNLKMSDSITSKRITELTNIRSSTLKTLISHIETLTK